MKKTALICFIFIVSAFLFSCEDDLQKNTEIASLTESQIDKNIKILSEVLAKAVSNNNALVKEIEEEISCRFDYDNDALIKIFLGRKIAGEKFENILSRSSNGKYSSKDIEKMILESGYLQFTFPQNYEALDYESISPLAVPVYSSINEKDTEFLESFDKDGNIVKLSTKEMPNVPVIVVGRSERVDEEGNLLVSERSVVLPKEMRTLHYTEAVKESRIKLKSAKLNQHFVTILSQEEFDKLEGGKEPIVANGLEGNLKSATFSDPQLTVKTVNPLQMILGWESYSNGTQTANRYKIFRDGFDTPIKEQYYSRSFTDYVPNENTEYTYQVQYFYNDQYLNESNLYSIHSSARKSGGFEYIERFYASHAMVVELEGWWVSELEIAWDICYAKADGTTGTIASGGDIWGCEKKANGDYITPRFVLNDRQSNLFQWSRTDAYSAYTVAFREVDRATNTKVWEINVELVGKIVELASGKNKIVQKIAEELVDPLKKLITVLKDDDKIGEADIFWWTPNGVEQSISPSGCRVIINHRY